MSKITDIRARQVIDCADEIGKVINATLGGDFTLNKDGSFELKPWDGVSCAARMVFLGTCAGRRFANRDSLLAILLDIQAELICLTKSAHQDAARYQWLRDPDRAASMPEEGFGPAGTINLIFVSDGKGESGIESASQIDGDALDAAIDAQMKRASA